MASGCQSLSCLEALIAYIDELLKNGSTLDNKIMMVRAIELILLRMRFFGKERSNKVVVFLFTQLSSLASLSILRYSCRPFLAIAEFQHLLIRGLGFP